jgi:hypothetical protein
MDEVLADFISTFEVHHTIAGRRKDDRVDVEEFVAYYNNISVSIDSDSEYELMMRNAWRLPLESK